MESISTGRAHDEGSESGSDMANLELYYSCAVVEHEYVQNLDRLWKKVS